MNMNKPITINSSFESQAKVFRALASPKRLAILNMFRDGEQCVCHLEAYLGLRQAYISQQLSVLRDAGLIIDRRDGWNNYYRVADNRIFPILDNMQTIIGNVKQEFFPITVNCSCPKCHKE
jgi:DNA-binding transcriptional ArsR family regulator